MEINIKESRANIIDTKKKWRRSCTRFEKFALDIGYREEKWLDVTRKREEGRQLSRVIDRREIRPRDFIRSLSRFSFPSIGHSFHTFFFFFFFSLLRLELFLSKKGYRANCILLLSNKRNDTSRKGRGEKRKVERTRVRHNGERSRHSRLYYTRTLRSK